MACGGCENTDGLCVFNSDTVNIALEKAKNVDGFQYKPGAAIVSCRRGGSTADFDQLNKYFTIANMPVVSSQYLNMVYRNTTEEVKQDLEGMQTM